MPDLKKARRDLHEVIESGSRNEIMEASQEVDKLILRDMSKRKYKKSIYKNRMNVPL